MNLSEIVPSRIYSWVYNPDAQKWSENNLKKGGRQGLPQNELYGRVTVRSVKSGQAATIDMYVRRAVKLNPSYVPQGDYTPRMEATENPCVFRSLSSGDYQVMIMEPKTHKVEYFVDGKPASPEELATIEMFRKAKQEPWFIITADLGNGLTQVNRMQFKSLAAAKEAMKKYENILDIHPEKVKVEFPYAANLVNVNIDELPETVFED